MGKKRSAFRHGVHLPGEARLYVSQRQVQCTSSPWRRRDPAQTASFSSEGPRFPFCFGDEFAVQGTPSLPCRDRVIANVVSVRVVVVVDRDASRDGFDLSHQPLLREQVM